MKFKKRIKAGVKKAFNISFIIKIGALSLALISVLGVVGSMFSGSSSGSSGGSSTVRPSRPGTSASDTEQTEQSEQIEESTPTTPDVPVELSMKSAVNEDMFSVYAGATDLKAILDFDMSGKKLSKGVGRSELMTEENGVQYVRIWGDGESNESYAFVHNLEYDKNTGRFLIFAYRLPETNVEKQDTFEIFVTSRGKEITGTNDRFFTTTQKDGEWHVGIVDMAEAVKTCPYYNPEEDLRFEPNEGGDTYSVSYLRFDWFTGFTSTDSYIDVAYIGVTQTLEKARAADPDYTGFEFTADYMQNLVANISDEANTVFTESSENGMPYYTLTSTVPPSKEPRLYLHSPSVKILLGSTQYIGLMYRNAPNSYSQVYANSTNVLTGTGYASESHTDYVQGSEWQFMVFELTGTTDTVLRTLRFDFYNNQTPGETVSVDIAFMKFFDSSEAANEYYQEYLNTYNLKTQKTISFTINGTEHQAVEGMTWVEWCDSEYNTVGADCDDGTMVHYTSTSFIRGVSESDTIIDGNAYTLAVGGGRD